MFFFSPIQEEYDFHRFLSSNAGKIRTLSLLHLLLNEKKKNFDRCWFSNAGNIRILSLFHLLPDEKKKNFDRCLFFFYWEPLDTESFFLQFKKRWISLDVCFLMLA